MKEQTTERRKEEAGEREGGKGSKNVTKKQSPNQPDEQTHIVRWRQINNQPPGKEQPRNE